LDNKLVAEELKSSIPSPSLVTSLSVVGFGEVLQQIPLAVIGHPPSLTMVPPEVKLFSVIDVAEFVEIIGNKPVLTVY
jgi:hypothetical protein